jgi:hypothetical protein
MTGSPYRIRASALPAWGDCARRTASKLFPDLLRDAGFELRPLFPSIGAAVGTATHAAVEHVLRLLMADRLTPLDAAASAGVQVAIEKLVEEIAPGAEWDDTTPNLQVAQQQIERLTRAYLPVAAEVEPAAVELELKADLGDGWEFSGHIDLMTVDGHLDDLKTGAIRRPYQAQLGGYSLLAKANGHAVQSVGITFVPRARKSKPQPPAERQRYELATAERAAWSTIQAIKRDVGAFEASGDPFAFTPNPMSLMCSRRYCPAWGTDFCTMHLQREDRETPVD